MYPLKWSHASFVKANSQSHKRLVKKIVLAITGFPCNWQPAELKQNSKFVQKGSANVVSVHCNRGAGFYGFAYSGIYRCLIFGLRLISYTLKVKVKVKFALEEATKAQRGSRDIAPIFL